MCKLFHLTADPLLYLGGQSLSVHYDRCHRLILSSAFLIFLFLGGIFAVLVSIFGGVWALTFLFRCSGHPLSRQTVYIQLFRLWPLFSSRNSRTAPATTAEIAASACEVRIGTPNSSRPKK